MQENQEQRLSRWLKLTLPAAAIVAAMILSIRYGSRYYGALSLVMVLAALVCFFLRYEQKRPPAREWIPLAVMASIAALGRMALAPVPHAKPMSAIIIITAMVFGAEAGFLTGALAVVGSNFFFGQGPWTPWQMFAWGMIGFVAGLLGKIGWLDKKWQRCVFGLCAGFMYGWVLNIWTAVTATAGEAGTGFIGLCLLSLPFDILHGMATVIFLWLLADSWGGKLRRVQVKFGLMKP